MTEEIKVDLLPMGNICFVKTSSDETVRRFKSRTSGIFTNVGDSRRTKTRIWLLVADVLPTDIAIRHWHRRASRKQVLDDCSLTLVELDNRSMQMPPTYRIAIAGCPGSGKRSLLRQFSTSKYQEMHSLTSDIESKQPMRIPVEIDGHEIRLQFEIINIETLDTKSLPVDACLVVYDVTDRSSFTSAAGILRSLKGMPGILAGNKADLVRSRAVSKKDGAMLSRMLKTKFLETSASFAYNIDQLLATCAAECRKCGSRHASVRRRNYIRNILIKLLNFLPSGR